MAHYFLQLLDSSISLLLQLEFITQPSKLDHSLVGKLVFVGVPRDVLFSWVYFLPKNSKVGYQFWRKILKQGNILLGNHPNFFVERMT